MEWRVTSTFFFFKMYTSALNSVCGVMEPGFAITIPRRISFLSIPRKQDTYVVTSFTFVQAILRNISTPVTD